MGEMVGEWEILCFQDLVDFAQPGSSDYVLSRENNLTDYSHLCRERVIRIISKTCLDSYQIGPKPAAFIFFLQQKQVGSLLFVNLRNLVSHYVSNAWWQGKSFELVEVQEFYTMSKTLHTS